MWIKINGSLINLNNIIEINTMKGKNNYGRKEYKIIFKTTRDKYENYYTDTIEVYYDYEEDMINDYKKIQTIIECKEIL